MNDYLDALRNLMESDPALNGSVFVADVAADAPERYVVLFPSLEYDADALTGPQSDHDFRLRVHSVGSTPEQALLVAGKVAAAVLNKRPNIPGRNSSRIRHIFAEPIRYDSSLSPRVYFAADEFAVRTTKE